VVLERDEGVDGRAFAIDDVDGDAVGDGVAGERAAEFRRGEHALDRRVDADAFDGHGGRHPGPEQESHAPAGPGRETGSRHYSSSSRRSRIRPASRAAAAASTPSRLSMYSTASAPS